MVVVDVTVHLSDGLVDLEAFPARVMSVVLFLHQLVLDLELPCVLGLVHGLLVHVEGHARDALLVTDVTIE